MKPAQLTPELMAWTSSQLASGRYRSGSEFVGTGLRLLQDSTETAVNNYPQGTKGLSTASRDDLAAR